MNEDFSRNKIWVCAYMSNLFNSYNVSSAQAHRQRTQCLNNFFDYEKWQSKYDPNHHAQQQDESPLRPQKQQSLLYRGAVSGLGVTNDRGQANNLMQKSESTAHIPSAHRAKYSKRIFGCFDKDTAERMFGYRVSYTQQPQPHTQTQCPPA